MTTLEEVFIKVNAELEDKDNPDTVTTDDFNMQGPIPARSRGSINNKKGVLIEEEEKALKDGQDAEADLMSSENLVG